MGLGSGGNRDFDVLLGEMHVGSESGVRLPLAGGAGSALLEHLVDLFELERY